MKPEKKLQKDLAKVLNRIPTVSGHEAIENGTACGTPDYAYTIGGINGWFELKVQDEPKDITKKLKIKHWTPNQRQWMKKRMLCPTVFLIVRIGEWDYIFDTKTMFFIENQCYAEIMEYHPWRVKFSDQKFWSFIELSKLSAKLFGISTIKERKELHEY
jgi:hypothetical protein